MGKPGPDDVIEEIEEENKSDDGNSKDILEGVAENKINDEIVNPEDMLISGIHVNKEDAMKQEETPEKSDLKMLLTEENLLVGNTNIEGKV